MSRIYDGEQEAKSLCRSRVVGCSSSGPGLKCVSERPKSERQLEKRQLEYTVRDDRSTAAKEPTSSEQGFPFRIVTAAFWA